MLDYALMLALAAFFIFPVWVMVVASFKPERLATGDLNSLLAFVPREVTVENYSCPTYRDPDSPCRQPGLLQIVPFFRVAFNSLFITFTTVAAGLLVNSLAAYALARLRWPGRALSVSLLIALIIIPFESVAVPLLLLVNALPWVDGSTSWINSYHVQIIPFIADAFFIFLFYQFFLGLPRELEEAARIDGAGYGTIYWRIVLPLSRPVLVTVAILHALAMWGAYLWPLMVTQGSDYRPLTVAMRTLFGQQPIQWGDIMAFASLITVPVLLLFLLFQRWFVQSVVSSSVKG